MRLFDSTRECLEDARRRKTVPRRSAPSFVVRCNVLGRAYAIQDRLLNEGELVFGAIVSVPSWLELAGSTDGSAGFVLYTHDGAAQRSPMLIEGYGDWLRTTIGSTQAHPALTHIATALGGHPIARTAVPTGFTVAVPYFVCAIPIRRIDLPGGRLRSSFLPILAHRDVDYALQLPLPLWGEDLIEAWVDRGA